MLFIYSSILLCPKFINFLGHIQTFDHTIYHFHGASKVDIFNILAVRFSDYGHLRRLHSYAHMWPLGVVEVDYAMLLEYIYIWCNQVWGYPAYSLRLSPQSMALSRLPQTRSRLSCSTIVCCNQTVRRGGSGLRLCTPRVADLLFGARFFSYRDVEGLFRDVNHRVVSLGPQLFQF